ncbi:MAG TPA: DUF6597 domain-containing transcriptional factor [Bacteroidales bacterium]
MILKHIIPKPALQPYIDSFWVFESDFGVPVTSSRVIVPSGKAKIIIPYKNPLFANCKSFSKESKENHIHFVGAWDEPVVISSHTRETGTIIIQLLPKGAYRFADFALHELTNQLFTFDELYGQQGKDIQNRIADTGDVIQKIELIQLFLIGKLNQLNQNQSIVDYVTEMIVHTHGLMEINQLVKKTGYSKRYIDLLFQRYIGLSPKTLAAVTRFQKFYSLWANRNSPDFYKDDLYNFYYDQSHFIKEFKNFTGGYSPTQYAEVNNDFGRIFYRR